MKYLSKFFYYTINTILTNKWLFTMFAFIAPKLVAFNEKLLLANLIVSLFVKSIRMIIRKHRSRNVEEKKTAPGHRDQFSAKKIK